MKETSTTKICPECNTIITINHHFEFPCDKCGNVYHESYTGKLVKLKRSETSYIANKNMLYKREEV